MGKDNMDGQPFTLQQMQGGPRYMHQCKIGNWNEDAYLEGMRRNAHKEMVKGGRLLLNVIKDRMAKALQPVDLTVIRDDGYVHFGDLCMLHSVGTNGFLSADLQDKDPRPGEVSYAITASQDGNPAARNTIYFDKVEMDGGDDTVRYGEPIKIRINPRLRGLARDNAGRVVNSPMFVVSTPVSFGNYAKHSHKCEVMLTPKDSHLSVWEIHVADPAQRFEYEGMPVRAGDNIVLKHRGTNEKLAALKEFLHSTDFGEEFEVCGCTKTTGGQQAVLLHEAGGQCGTLNERPLKPVNHWTICIGSIVREPTTADEATMIDMDTILSRFRTVVGQGPVNGIKNLGRAYRSRDSDSTGLIPFAEFQACLKEQGIELQQGEASALNDTFGGPEGVAYLTFLVALRGHLSERRLAMVRKTFAGLIQMGSTGILSLREAIGNFDPTLHPRVASGKVSPEDFFREVADVFQGATEHLACDEWEEYFEEMGAASSSDEEFYATSSACWGISDVMGASYSVKGPGPIV